MRQWNLKKSSNWGFSLIEVMIVLALIALIMALVGANYSFLNRILVRSEVEKLCVICRYLQNGAVVKNTQQALAFDAANNTYAYNNQHHKLSAQVTFGFLPGTKGPPSSPQAAIKNPITFPKGKITFHPDGIISSGTVYLIDSSQQFMYALSSPISQVSYLRKYQYNKGWKLIS